VISQTKAFCLLLKVGLNFPKVSPLRRVPAVYGLRRSSTTGESLVHFTWFGPNSWGAH